MSNLSTTCAYVYISIYSSIIYPLSFSQVCGKVDEHTPFQCQLWEETRFFFHFYRAELLFRTPFCTFLRSFGPISIAENLFCYIWSSSVIVGIESSPMIVCDRICFCAFVVLRFCLSSREFVSQTVFCYEWWQGECIWIPPLRESLLFHLWFQTLQQ